MIDLTSPHPNLLFHAANLGEMLSVGFLFLMILLIVVYEIQKNKMKRSEALGK